MPPRVRDRQLRANPFAKFPELLQLALKEIPEFVDRAFGQKTSSRSRNHDDSLRQLCDCLSILRKEILELERNRQSQLAEALPHSRLLDALQRTLAEVSRSRVDNGYMMRCGIACCDIIALYFRAVLNSAEAASPAARALTLRFALAVVRSGTWQALARQLAEAEAVAKAEAGRRTQGPLDDQRGSSTSSGGSSSGASGSSSSSNSSASAGDGSSSSSSGSSEAPARPPHPGSPELQGAAACWLFSARLFVACSANLCTANQHLLEAAGDGKPLPRALKPVADALMLYKPELLAAWTAAGVTERLWRLAVLLPPLLPPGTVQLFGAVTCNLLTFVAEYARCYEGLYRQSNNLEKPAAGPVPKSVTTDLMRIMIAPCMSYALLIRGLAALCAMDGGSSYGAPPELLAAAVRADGREDGGEGGGSAAESDAGDPLLPPWASDLWTALSMLLTVASLKRTEESLEEAGTGAAAGTATAGAGAAAGAGAHPPPQAAAAAAESEGSAAGSAARGAAQAPAARTGTKAALPESKDRAAPGDPVLPPRPVAAGLLVRVCNLAAVSTAYHAALGAAAAAGKGPAEQRAAAKLVAAAEWARLCSYGDVSVWRRRGRQQQQQWSQGQGRAHAAPPALPRWLLPAVKCFNIGVFALYGMRDILTRPLTPAASGSAGDDGGSSSKSASGGSSSSSSSNADASGASATGGSGAPPSGTAAGAAPDVDADAVRWWRQLALMLRFQAAGGEEEAESPYPNVAYGLLAVGLVRAPAGGKSSDPTAAASVAAAYRPGPKIEARLREEQQQQRQRHERWRQQHLQQLQQRLQQQDGAAAAPQAQSRPLPPPLLPPGLAAAVAGGLLPDVLEAVRRRSGWSVRGQFDVLADCVALGLNPAAFGGLLVLAPPRQSASLVVTIGKLLRRSLLCPLANRSDELWWQATSALAAIRKTVQREHRRHAGAGRAPGAAAGGAGGDFCDAASAASGEQPQQRSDDGDVGSSTGTIGSAVNNSGSSSVSGSSSHDTDDDGDDDAIPEEDSWEHAALLSERMPAVTSLLVREWLPAVVSHTIDTATAAASTKDLMGATQRLDSCLWWVQVILEHGSGGGGGGSNSSHGSDGGDGGDGGGCAAGAAAAAPPPPSCSRAVAEAARGEGSGAAQGTCRDQQGAAEGCAGWDPELRRFVLHDLHSGWLLRAALHIHARLRMGGQAGEVWAPFDAYVFKLASACVRYAALAPEEWRAWMLEEGQGQGPAAAAAAAAGAAAEATAGRKAAARSAGQQQNAQQHQQHQQEQPQQQQQPQQPQQKPSWMRCLSALLADARVAAARRHTAAHDARCVERFGLLVALTARLVPSSGAAGSGPAASSASTGASGGASTSASGDASTSASGGASIGGASSSASIGGASEVEAETEEQEAAWRELVGRLRAVVRREAEGWAAVVPGGRVVLLPLSEAGRRLQLPGLCSNPACVQLEGDCEAEVVLKACGGGCGGAAAYCCRDCQVVHWRAGHKQACGQKGRGAV